MKKLINNWIQSWTFYHVLFWGGLIISHAVDTFELTRYDVTSWISHIVVRNSLLIGLTYFNIFLLIPRFFRKGKIRTYWALLFLSTVVFVLMYNNFLFNYIPVFMRGVYEKTVAFQIVSNFFTACRYLVLSVLLKFMQDWFEQEKKLNQLTIDKLSTELNYLRVQINPHFLFNTLNNLYGLALKKSDLTPQVIMKLSDIMEYMLLESADTRVALKKEVENIRNYIDLEKIRQTNNNIIDFEVAGNPGAKSIEPFLLFPFFENAFKHGLNNSPDKGFIVARLEGNTEGLFFTLNNSKPPGYVHPVTGHGIGLSNLRKRLNLLYPEKHTLEIVDSKENFFVTLKLKE